MEKATRAQRIYIIGAGGSGKTTLAQALAPLLGVEPVELDLNPYADLGELAARDRWIVEGVFLYDIAPLLDRADVIVWLDLPPRVAQRRIVTRHLKLSFLRRNRYPGLPRLARFVRSMSQYYTKAAEEPLGADDWVALSRALTAQRVAPHVHKLAPPQPCRSPILCPQLPWCEHREWFGHAPVASLSWAPQEPQGGGTVGPSR